MPSVSFNDLNSNFEESNMSYQQEELSSYDYVRRVSEDLNRYKLSDLIELEEYEEDFFGNRLHNFSTTLPKTLKTYRSPFENPTCFIRDFFEELDFFGNPIISYPPRRSMFQTNKDYMQDSYSNSYKDDFFKDFTNYSSYSKPPKGLPRERSHSRERSRERSPSLRRTSLGSTGTASSMDALWDLHPRRLSEAGLSRYSDNSTVLTEDTNSFIIGQRVFVGGTKPGQIAYIGETQFAPGEWAGIVLDQPIGKNDGSVGGIRYFQCEAKRGVFSRLTRLTRYPLGPDASAGGGGDSSYCASPSPTNGVRKSPMSPTYSTRSALSISNTSLASAHVDFKIGERVIIKSSQGSKVGTLRYIGFTTFANGEWCGVELDEPRGKNDGSVAGERYFDCRPNYGLFAPVSKVSKSPSNRKPGNCVVHSSMRRSNSKESLMSLSSSLASASVTSAVAARRVRRLGVTSLTPKKSQTPPKANSTPMPSRTALQDVLKEKQQHIEQLLKERDLERAEITKAASLADEAEQKYVSLKKEFENYRIDYDRKFKEATTKLGQLETDNKELLGQLDEEKQKNEDWQFKFEETTITKNDVEHLVNAQKSTNEEYVGKITDMEMKIGQLKAQLEVESGRVIQSHDELMSLREENESIKVDLEHANEKRSSLENEETKSIELVQTLQSQLEDANSALKQHQEVSVKQIDDLNKQLTKVNSEHEVDTFKLNKEIEEIRAKYANDISTKNDELKMLTSNYEETKTILENTQKDHEKYKYDVNVIEQGSKKDVDKLKMEISAKVLELETQHDLVKAQSDDIKKLEDALSKTQKDLETQIRETENVNMEEEKSMMEVSKLQQLLDASNAEVAKARNELQAHIENGKKEMESSNVKYTDLHEQLNALKTELLAKSEQLQESAMKFQTTEEELAKACQKVEKGKTECAQMQEKLQQELQNVKEAKEKESQLELQLGDAQRNIQQIEEQHAAAIKQKEKLEVEVQQLIGVSGEESGKLEILNTQLHNKQSELEQCTQQYDQKIKDLEHSLQEVNIKLTNVTEHGNTEKQELENEIVRLRSEMKEGGETSEKSIDSLHKLVADYKNELETAKQQANEKDKALEKFKQVLDGEVQVKNELESNLIENKKLTNELQQKIEETDKELAKVKEELSQRNEQFQTVSKNMKMQSNESQEAVTTMQQEFEKQRGDLEAALNEKETTLKELLSQIEDIEKQNSQKDASTAEKDLEIENLKQVHIDVKKHAEELRVDCENNTQLLANTQQELSKLNEKYHELASKLTEKEHELHEAHKTESVIMEKNSKITTLEGKLEELNKTIESITNQLEVSKTQELQTQKDLDEKLSHMQKLQNALVSKEQEGMDVNSNLLSKNEEINKLQSELVQVNNAMQEIEKGNVQLKGELSKLHESNSQLQASNNSEVESMKQKHTVYDKLLKQLKITEEHKQELLTSKVVKETELLNDLVKTLNVQPVNDNRDKIQELEKMINTNNEILVAANQKIQHQQTEITLLQQDLLKAKLDSTKKVTTVQIADETIINNNAMNSNDYKQLLEEKLEAENQVEFLHTIIADMQKKNEEQKARIEILESGYSPAAADELKLMGLIEKKIAPRLYCDICEEFDLHETEDCPTQADDDMPPPPPPGGKKEKQPPRPYCEICEGNLIRNAENAAVNELMKDLQHLVMQQMTAQKKKRIDYKEF